MIISLVHADGRTEFFEINKFPVLVGRAPECHVCIESENISREHLEIHKKEDQFYIRDMTLSNWVSYNGNPLAKSELVEYIAFSELTLPGGYQLTVSPSEGDKKKPAEIKPKIDLYSSPLKAINRKKIILGENKEAPKKIPKKISKRDISLIYVLIFIFIVSGGYFYYDNQLPSTEVAHYSKEQKSNPIKNVPIVRKKTIVKDELLMKMLSKFNKCGQASVTQVCENLIPKRFSREGAIDFQKSLFVFKDVTRRVNLYKAEIENIEEIINLRSEKGLKIIAAQNTLLPTYLPRLVPKKTQFIYINLYDEKNPSLGIIKTYKISIQNLKTVSKKIYEKAFEDLQVGVGTDVFETYIFAIMQPLEEN